MLKVGVGGTAIKPPMEPHAQLIGGEESTGLSKEVQDFAFGHRARILFESFISTEMEIWIRGGTCGLG